MNIFLRDVEASDLPIFYQQQQDPQASAMAAFPMREREAFDAHWVKVLADAQSIVRVIVCDGQVAGNVLSFIMQGEREVGYWLGREFWGKGIASEALRQFLEAFKERPLYAYAAAHNTGSIRVLEKCGFLAVGTIEENGVTLLRFELAAQAAQPGNL